MASVVKKVLLLIRGYFFSIIVSLNCGTGCSLVVFLSGWQAGPDLCGVGSKN
jgi:hypothetical protein